MKIGSRSLSNLRLCQTIISEQMQEREQRGPADPETPGTCARGAIHCRTQHVIRNYASCHPFSISPCYGLCMTFRQWNGRSRNSQYLSLRQLIWASSSGHDRLERVTHPVPVTNTISAESCCTKVRARITDIMRPKYSTTG